MLFARHEGEKLGYVLSVDVQLSKTDREIGLTKGIEFQAGIFVGEKSFSEIAAIAQECEEFVSSLRTKYRLEPPKMPDDGRIRGR